MNLFHIDKMEKKCPAKGVELCFLSGERMTFAYFKLAKGSQVPEHSHPHEQIGMVIRGRLRLKVQGEEQEVIGGNIYHIPSDVSHGAVALEECEVIEVFSPRREDL